MLTLMPLSGIQSALRKKNNKNYDFSRRGSLSVYSTYSLPTSKSSMRRFSSYEGLAPIFQQFLAQQAGEAMENASPVTSRSPSPPPPPPPPPEKRKRRASFSLGKRLRRLSGVGLSAETSVEVNNSYSGSSSKKCSVDDLDNMFTKIRDQLAQLKNEDIEICQRVEDLHNSVGDLYRERQPEPVRHIQFTSSLTDSPPSPRQPASSQKSPVSPSPSDSIAELRRQSMTMPSNLSSSSLAVIRESSFEILDDDLSPEEDSSSEDEQSFEDYCRRTIPKLGNRQPISFTALDAVDLTADQVDPKKFWFPNNLEVQRPRSNSSPQLQLIRNNLSDDDSSKQRWSVVSAQSDSILLSKRRHSFQSSN